MRSNPSSQKDHREHVRYLNQGYGQGCWIKTCHEPFPDDALYIQVPIFDTTVAVHSTVKVVLRKGLQAELGPSAAVLFEVPVTRCCRIGRSTIRMRAERPHNGCYVRLLFQSHRLRENRRPRGRTKAVG